MTIVPGSSPAAQGWAAQIVANVNLVRLTLLLAILFTSAAALVLQSPPVIFMAALLWGAPLMSLVAGRFASRGLTVRRVLAEVGTVGDVMSGEVMVENRFNSPLFLVQVQSGEVTGPSTGPARLQLLPNRAAPADPQDAAAEDESETATARVQALGGEEQMAPLLRGGERIVWRQHWLLRQRGVYELPPARAGVVDPLGLYNQLPARSRPDRITVLPRPVKVDRLFFFGSGTAGLNAPRHAACVTNAMDFHSVREWQPGEAIRRVHWKNTARTGKLHVVEWEEDAAADVAVLLDTQASMIAGTATDNTLESAITIAASVAAYLLENGYQFQLFYWDPQATGEAGSLQVRHLEARNARSLGTALHEMAAIVATDNEAATLPHLAHSALPLIPAGRAVLVLASSRADIDGARGALGGITQAGASCHTLALDAASFAAQQAPSSLAERAGAAAAHAHEAYASSGQVRLVRHGDSLSAALDQLL